MLRIPQYFKAKLMSGAALLGLLIFNESAALGLDLKPSEIKSKPIEKPVAVLQKRFFEKTLRPEFGLLSGSLLDEAYTKTEKRGARLGLFFTEWLGVEAQYVDTSVTSSQDKKALEKLKFKKAKPEEGEDPDALVTPEPEINRIHQIIDLDLVFAPFYGKMNLMDYFIVYLDTYLTLGGAQIKTDQGNKNAITMGIGQRYYFFKSLSVRLDFKNQSFTEDRAGKATKRNLKSWDIGVSWFFL